MTKDETIYLIKQSIINKVLLRPKEEREMSNNIMKEYDGALSERTKRGEKMKLFTSSISANNKELPREKEIQ